ncbi:MAG: response regulator [Rhodoglobus sp.]
MTTSRPSQVLVVEDSADQAGLLRQYFEKAGCTVRVVTTGEDALAASADLLPDLAVIDLVLPGMDGWELVTRFRSELPGCAIVVTSVLDTADFPEADGILPKPFTGAQVRKVLADLDPRWRLG